MNLRSFLWHGKRAALVLLSLGLSAGAQQAASPRADAPLRLTLRDAVERGLVHQVRVRLAETRVDESAAARERRLSALLPRARVEVSASLQNRNLRAFGISFPGTPEVVDPFSNYDFRLYAESAVVDRQLYHQWKATEQQERAARNELQDTRDQVVRLIAALYLNAQAAAARLRAAESRVRDAEALLALARERREAGVATGVDVLRAQVQLSHELQRRLEASLARQQALFQLARNIGLRPGTAIELAEQLEFQEVAVPEAGEALAAALAARPDYLSLASQRDALAAQQRANRARYLPRFTVGTNFGGLGRTFSGVRATGAVQGTISMTVFDRDRSGEEAELASRLRRIEAQMEDLRLGIELEIREALLALESAAQEVRVSREGRALAERELELARDRFAAGVTSNIEVVTAQDALARALENEILAATRHADARMALARALGGTEKNYLMFARAGQPD